MRIITGTARGTRLTTLEGTSTRPTSEVAKEAIFSMIQFEVEGRRVLDLFAGSGQLALEALSRGALSATMVDHNPDAVKILKANAQKTKLFARSRILCSDFRAFLRSMAGKEQFDLVFLDPPYAEHLTDEVLSLLQKGNLLAPSALIFCESEDGSPQVLPAGLFEKRAAKYGRIRVKLLTNTDPALAEA